MERAKKHPTPQRGVRLTNFVCRLFLTALCKVYDFDAEPKAQKQNCCFNHKIFDFIELVNRVPIAEKISKRQYLTFATDVFTQLRWVFPRAMTPKFVNCEVSAVSIESIKILSIAFTKHPLLPDCFSTFSAEISAVKHNPTIFALQISKIFEPSLLLSLGLANYVSTCCCCCHKKLRFLGV